MTREEAKAFYPILQAFAEGKVIETRTDPNVVGKGLEDMNDWTEMNEIEHWNNIQYRVKPEPTYRPFKNAEECWQELLKHQPFGWVIKKCEKKIIIAEVLTLGVKLHRQEIPYGFDEANRILTFSDGVPFGVKVEE